MRWFRIAVGIVPVCLVLLLGYTLAKTAELLNWTEERLRALATVMMNEMK